MWRIDLPSKLAEPPLGSKKSTPSRAKAKEFMHRRPQAEHKESIYRKLLLFDGRAQKSTLTGLKTSTSDINYRASKWCGTSARLGGVEIVFGKVIIWYLAFPRLIRKMLCILLCTPNCCLQTSEFPKIPKGLRNNRVVLRRPKATHRLPEADWKNWLALTVRFLLTLNSSLVHSLRLGIDYLWGLETL